MHEITDRGPDPLDRLLAPRPLPPDDGAFRQGLLERTRRLLRRRRWGRRPPTSGKPWRVTAGSRPCTAGPATATWRRRATRPPRCAATETPWTRGRTRT